uniref:Immunoglobulin V-set domain-containing protein n=1 Tax=Canis lupus familiaris TaxID=9615 RepID=A0A8P0TK94_CANLF
MGRPCPSRLTLALFPSLAGPVEAGVTQTLRYLITGTRRQLTLLCSQDMNRDAMYWYGQDPGLGLKLIYSSRNVQFTEKGDVPDGYWKDAFPLILESARINQTSVYFCASSYARDTAPSTDQRSEQEPQLAPSHPASSLVNSRPQSRQVGGEDHSLSCSLCACWQIWV